MRTLGGKVGGILGCCTAAVQLHLSMLEVNSEELHVMYFKVSSILYLFPKIVRFSIVSNSTCFMFTFFNIVP